MRRRAMRLLSTDVGQQPNVDGNNFTKYLYPRTNITSGGLGTMGFFHFPRQIGVAAGRQDLPGDLHQRPTADFQMNMQEMGTILEYNLPIKIFIINNGFPWNGSSVAGSVSGRKRYSAVEMKKSRFLSKLAEAYDARRCVCLSA